MQREIFVRLNPVCARRLANLSLYPPFGIINESAGLLKGKILQLSLSSRKYRVIRVSITLIAIVFLSYVSIQSFRADIHFEENNSTGPITLENGEKWEKKMGFTPIKPGKDIKVSFSFTEVISLSPTEACTSG